MQSLFNKKRLQDKRFLVKFAKFLRISFFTERPWWLLLYLRNSRYLQNSGFCTCYQRNVPRGWTSLIFKDVRKGCCFEQIYLVHFIKRSDHTFLRQFKVTLGGLKMMEKLVLKTADTGMLRTYLNRYSRNIYDIFQVKCQGTCQS